MGVTAEVASDVTWEGVASDYAVALLMFIHKLCGHE